MGANLLVIGIVTAFWLVIGFIVPCFIKGQNQGVIKMSAALTAVCAWLFWIIAYLTQLNPLIGPKLKNSTLFMLAQEWGNAVKA